MLKHAKVLAERAKRDMQLTPEQIMNTSMLDLNSRLMEQAAKDFEQLMIDTLDTAFYGGIGYWAMFGEWENPLPKGAYLPEQVVKGNEVVILDCETGERLGILNRNKLVEALDKIPSHYYDELMSGQWDVVTADVLVQYAVLGKIVYG